MHISDGILGTPVVAVTTVAAIGLIGYAVRGIKESEIPKTALMSAVFFAGSLIHFNVGGSSVHLLLSGIIGLILGRRTPIAISIALIFQLLLFQFGGLSSFGANVLDTAIPAMLLAHIFRPFLGRSAKTNFVCGVCAGGFSVILTIVMVSIMLIESNMRYGFGLFSAVTGLMIAHIPVALIEAVVTGFAVKMIADTRPDIVHLEKKQEECK